MGKDTIPKNLLASNVSTKPLSRRGIIRNYRVDLKLSREYSPTQRKKAVIVTILKKCNNSSVSNYRQISLLNYTSKVFEFVLRDHTSHYLKHKLSPSKYGFLKVTSTTTNLVTYREFILLQVLLSVKLIIFILTLAVNLTLFRLLFYFTDFVLMGLLTVA